MWKGKVSRIAKTTFKKNKVRKISDSKTYNKTRVINAIQYLHQLDILGQQNRIEKLEIDSERDQNFSKSAKVMQCVKRQSV